MRKQRFIDRLTERVEQGLPVRFQELLRVVQRIEKLDHRERQLRKRRSCIQDRLFYLLDRLHHTRAFERPEGHRLDKQILRSTASPVYVIALHRRPEGAQVHIDGGQPFSAPPKIVELLLALASEAAEDGILRARHASDVMKALGIERRGALTNLVYRTRELLLASGHNPFLLWTQDQELRLLTRHFVVYDQHRH